VLDTNVLVSGLAYPADMPDIQNLIDAFTILAEVVTPDAVSDSELRDAADRPVLGTLFAAMRSGAAQPPTAGGPRAAAP
jgi:hypothetical protein